MRLLVSWLGEFVTVDASVDQLAEILTMRGFEVSAIERLPAGIGVSDHDAVLNLEITTNRPDCLSVLGIAREVSTIYDKPLLRPDLAEDDPAAIAAADDLIDVTIENAELSPRYATAVTEVTVGASPSWLAARLEAAGVRPLNNVVDVTNYVMLECGQPMHAFDLDRLAGHALRIRCARPGETIRTLDGQQRPLQPEMLVIADAERPQAIAGVMGGAESEVTAETRTIVLESAYFLPTSVRRTSKQLGLSTDASYRFERGADPEVAVQALRRARALLAQIDAGRPLGPIVDRYPAPKTARVVELRHARITRVLGQEVEPAFVPRTLGRLGFDVHEVAPSRAGPRWHVTIPSHRVDVNREVDLVEEIARHHGYDRLPSTFPALVRAPAPPGRWLQRNRLLRQVLTASGCWEAITYGFIEKAAAVPFVPNTSDTMPIANPISEKFSVLRPSLLPGLIDSLVWNRRREQRDIRLFEIGKRFQRSTGETPGVAFVMTGSGLPKHWSAGERLMDVFDAKGVVERVCDALGVTPIFEPVDRPELVLGRAAAVRAGVTGTDAVLGFVGQLSPAIAMERGLPSTGNEIYVAELDLDALDQVATDRDTMQAVPLPKYPSIVRDIAILIDATLPARVVRDTIQAAAPETLVSLLEFDRYEGKNVLEGRVSLAFRLTFRANDRTLTDTEIKETMDTIVAALKNKHQATLR